MNNKLYKNIKPLLYEPSKFGHGPVILKYIVNILSEYEIPFVVIDKPLNSKKLICDLIEITHKENCNILHFLTFDGLFRHFLKYSLFNKPKKLKIVANYYLYNNLYEFPKSYFFDYLLTTKVISKILISDEFIQSRHYPKWKSDLIGYVPDPWSPIDFKLCSKDDARAILELPYKKTIFLMFGELSFRKGINYFIDSLVNLYHCETNSFVGVIAGQISSDVKKTETYDKIMFLKNKSKLIIHDHFVAEELVSKYFSAADFLVCPYPRYFKVSSGTFTRACAAGIPSIVPNSSNLALTVKNIGAGYTFCTESVQSLTSVLKSLISVQSSEIDSLRQNLQIFANEKTVDHYGQFLLDTYVELIGINSLSIH